MPPDPPAARQWTLDADPSAVRSARRHARAFAEAHGAAEDAVHAVVLAVSEAVTNAVLHAYTGGPPGTVELTLEAGPGALRVEVADSGRGILPRTDSPGMGVGLSTMARLAARLDVREGPGGRGTVVRLTFRAPGVRGTGGPHDEAEARLLVAAADLAHSAAWPQEGFEQLCDLVLGAFADVACVDVAEHGTLHRLAARVAGDEALTAWLTGNAPPLRPGTATWAALRENERSLVVHDASVPRSPGGTGEVLGLGWWLSLPLAEPGGPPLAVWGLGGRGDRPPPSEATVALLAEAAARAAGGLANATVLAAVQTTRRRLEAVLAGLGEAVTVSDAQGRIAYANPAAADLLGFPSPAELLAAPPAFWVDRFLVTYEDGTPFGPQDMPAARLARGEPAPPVRTRAVDRVTGRVRWLHTTARPVDGESLVANVIADVTRQVLAEQRRRASVAVGAALDVREPDPSAVAALLVPVIADACAIDLLRDGGLRRVALAHEDPAQRERLQALHDGWPASLDPPTLAVLDGPARLVADITDEVLQLRARDDAHLALLREIGLRSLVVAPLRCRGVVCGLLTLVHDGASARTFAEEDVTFAVDLGRRIGAALGG